MLRTIFSIRFFFGFVLRNTGIVEYFDLQFNFNEINRLVFEVISPCANIGQYA